MTKAPSKSDLHTGLRDDEHSLVSGLSSWLASKIPGVHLTHRSYNRHGEYCSFAVVGPVTESQLGALFSPQHDVVHNGVGNSGSFSSSGVRHVSDNWIMTAHVMERFINAVQEKGWEDSGHDPLAVEAREILKKPFRELKENELSTLVRYKSADCRSGDSFPPEGLANASVKKLENGNYEITHIEADTKLKDFFPEEDLGKVTVTKTFHIAKKAAQQALGLPPKSNAKVKS